LTKGFTSNLAVLFAIDFDLADLSWTANGGNYHLAVVVRQSTVISDVGPDFW